MFLFCNLTFYGFYIEYFILVSTCEQYSPKIKSRYSSTRLSSKSASSDPACVTHTKSKVLDISHTRVYLFKGSEVLGLIYLRDSLALWSFEDAPIELKKSLQFLIHQYKNLIQT